jgi:hypothetical protein
MISKLSSTLLCGGQPARGPTSGSLAYLNKASASLSRQGRSKILLVSIGFSYYSLYDDKNTTILLKKSFLEKKKQ